MEIVNRLHAKNLVEFARNKPEILVLSADLTSSCEADLFRDNYPDRFISAGIAEQNMMSVAGGLAREGFVPLVHTFGVFIYRRAYDQVAMSVAYPNLPVKMFAFLPGITTPGGATHQAIEDIAVMRALPNMTVLEVGDASEAEAVLDLACAVPGPVYVRMLRGEIPRLFPRAEGLRLDTPKILSSGSDLAVISSGICTEEAMRAVAALQSKGVAVLHVHISTLKPFANPALRQLLSIPRHGIITVENHTVIGGLGTLIAEKLAAYGISRKLVTLGLPDTFSHGASRKYLLKRHGMDAMSIIREAESILDARLGIGFDALAAMRIEAVHSLAKPEAL